MTDNTSASADSFSMTFQSDADRIIAEAKAEALAGARAAFDALCLPVDPLETALRQLVSRPAVIELELGDEAVLIVNRGTGARLEISASALRLFDASGTQIGTLLVDPLKQQYADFAPTLKKILDHQVAIGNLSAEAAKGQWEMWVSAYFDGAGTIQLAKGESP